MRQNDGGPAFPGPESHGDDHEGMSLRDYFAAQAIVAAAHADTALSRDDEEAQKVAKRAYALADAMIAERLK